MTGPVTTDDVVAGCVKFLTAKSDILALLGTGVLSSASAPWLFQRHLYVRVENSGSTAAVISRNGGWGGANIHNTLRFPRVGLEIYVDPQRNAAGQVTQPGEAELRAHAAWLVFDKYLHMAAGGQAMWGTVRIIGSTRLGDPSIQPVNDSDGLQRLQVFYGVQEG